ncbi:MAG: tetraacyldisaccharide 4'-kinase [Gemmatimonadaceae bacterium]|nr:tetraacyldisaccharide 4'-kinase [Gemmatimonadaceae bacterium]MCC6429760.1 tetraacyldisaccharide 4'-kinase [Gemmatimonadaceae bacterium]
MSAVAWVHAIWRGDTMGARAVRSALLPASWVFGAIVARRNARFDAATLRRAALPSLSVGNLTVGGTGKTPVAAWCVEQLRARGARPAIVMRGVGDDEWRVHGLLNPGTPVIVSADRSDGVFTARARGADCVVLDDAFQHRQAARVADVVLVSADGFSGRAHLLPAGPYREPLTALRRAQAVIVTVKAADASQVRDVVAAVHAAAPDVPVAVARLAPKSLRMAVSLRTGTPDRSAPPPPRGLLSHGAEWVAGREFSVTSAIGDPDAFERQLVALGASIRRTHRFADHHAYTAAEAETIASGASGCAGVICTLKDAVKLEPLWPREAPPLWYLSQSVVVERGAEVLDRVLTRVLTARTATAPTAG